MCEHPNVSYVLPTKRPIPFEAFKEYVKEEIDTRGNPDFSKLTDMFLQGELDVICRKCGEDLTVDTYTEIAGYEKLSDMSIEELLSHIAVR